MKSGVEASIGYFRTSRAGIRFFFLDGYGFDQSSYKKKELGKAKTQ